MDCASRRINPGSASWPGHVVKPYARGVTRRLAAMAACGLLALAVAACNDGVGSARGTPGHGKKIVRAGSVVEHLQPGELVLPAGRSSAQYRITAPSPAKYAFDVSVTAPASATVAVNMRTWYGTMLSVLDSTHDRAWCRRRGSQDICFLPFPFLPAQLAGKWMVVASKQLGPPAAVRVVVAFTKP